MSRFSLWPALLRAGAFDALHGAHPGEPGVGLGVMIRTPADLQAALNALGQTRATLLVDPGLGAGAPDLLAQATRAGHEIAGLGRPVGLTTLEAAAGQPLRYWLLEEANLTAGNLQALRLAGLRPWPLEARIVEPGRLLRAEVHELEALLPELKARAYQAKPLRALSALRSGRPRDLFNQFYQRVVEDRYAQQEGIIDLSGRFDAVMRVAPLTHAPAPLPLAPGTPTAELHLNSGRLVGLASKQWLGTYRAYQRGLKDVAQALENYPELRDAQAVFAVTLFHGPLEKSGFTLLDLPPVRRRWYALGFRLLRLAYGTARPPGDPIPKMAWMERGEFLKKYG